MRKAPACASCRGFAWSDLNRPEDAARRACFHALEQGAVSPPDALPARDAAEQGALPAEDRGRLVQVEPDAVAVAAVPCRVAQALRAEQVSAPDGAHAARRRFRVD